MRIGIGFDAHRLERGRRLYLGGVEIPFGRGLAGHSDADVVLHALMDALLGACGAGDIGEMFPEADSAYEDASSIQLLEEVLEVVERGYRVVNVDVVVICEEPRMLPYREGIKLRIAEALGVETERVSIKGKTTEGMGFTGAGEGIACMAVALVQELERKE